jgi:signal transduction histidine kinase/integral membrane sensor domain MASE1
MFGSSLQRIVREPRLRAVLAFCLFEAAYFVAYRYAMAFSQASASPFWFPDSVLLCALLLNPTGRWWMFVLGTLPIRLLSEVARDIPVWFLLTTFTIDSARNLLTALALRRFLQNPIRFETVREFVLYCAFAVFLMPAVFALGGAAARSVRGHDFWTAWEQWFLGNALAHLVVTPAIIYWVFGDPWKVEVRSPKRWLEGALLMVALVVTSYVAFDTGAGWTDFAEPRFYAPVPFLFWAAIRFGMLGASGSIAVLALVSVQAALAGRGLFSGQSPADTALALQHFLLLRAAPLYLIAILTEQRHAVERSLLESQERMGRAVKAAKLWLWEWDIASDQIWLTDPRPDRIDLGRSAPVRLDVLMQSIHPDDRDGLREGLARAMTGKGPYEDRYRYTLRDGRLRWVLAVGRVELDAAGNAVRMRGVSRDITDSVRIEHQLQQQRDELVQISRVALLGELSGSLAHELNQPLTAILANAQAAQRFLSQDNLEEVREILGDIVADDRRAGEIIQRLRQLFRRGALQWQPIEINELVRDVAKLAHGELTSADVDLHTELADDLPMINGDRVPLQQLLLNLITNGCHAMSDVARPGRRLTVRTGFRADEGVRVTVSDVGHGIAEDHLPHVFDPFFTTRPAGMGLGLTVCRTIVSAHQGKLWAENNGDRGASFHVVLPRADAST